MGMSGSGGSSSAHGARRRRRAGHVMSEINVTPMVDVMLVLLIIFMVAAPMLTVGVPIEMPQTSANPLNEEKEPLTITVNQTGQVFLQETPIDVTELAPRLIAITNSGYEERIYVRGDKNVNFGQVAKVMGALSGAGFKRVALVTEQEQGS
ncbi:protein TolR [Hansschlegelia quercus]|uniref:Protein TolR n=1 Tax=Hansschlegelia quercus TaxID=2528245 RepID=A0A4Q9GKY4_9HYPH|nr:protein TolR [Hansschlegelia quercus]TBN54963.1 protein TolR [Hansschlegelia quercus]